MRAFGVIISRPLLSFVISDIVKRRSADLVGLMTLAGGSLRPNQR